MSGSEPHDVMIQRAVEIIGVQQPDDYVIAPATHAEEFETTARLLAAMLRSQSIRMAAREYEQLDGKALAAQANFKITARRANLGVLLAACFAAVVLVVGNLATVLWPSVVTAAFLFL